MGDTGGGLWPQQRGLWVLPTAAMPPMGRGWEDATGGHLHPRSRVSPGRKDVTLRKLDIKVETVNREPLTLHADREEDTASVSTATRVMKAIYSVRDSPRRGVTPQHPSLPRAGTDGTREE